MLQANHRVAAFTAVAVELLSMWLRTVLDDGKRNALKYFTLVRDCGLPEQHLALGRHAYNEQMYACIHEKTNEQMNESIHTAV